MTPTSLHNICIDKFVKEAEAELAVIAADPAMSADFFDYLNTSQREFLSLNQFTLGMTIKFHLKKHSVQALELGK